MQQRAAIYEQVIWWEVSQERAKRACKDMVEYYDDFLGTMQVYEFRYKGERYWQSVLKIYTMGLVAGIYY